MPQDQSQLAAYRKYYRKSLGSKLFDSRVDLVSKYLTVTSDPTLITGDFCLNHQNRILSNIHKFCKIDAPSLAWHANCNRVNKIITKNKI